jgi:hypothetical protein
MFDRCLPYLTDLTTWQTSCARHELSVVHHLSVNPSADSPPFFLPPWILYHALVPRYHFLLPRPLAYTVKVLDAIDLLVFLLDLTRRKNVGRLVKTSLVVFSAEIFLWTEC